MVVTDGFMSFARDKVREGVVRRIIIDKIHVVFTDSGFRPCLNRAHSIVELGVPIFGLSATFPASLNTELRRRFSINPSRELLAVRRSSTERPSISPRSRLLTDKLPC
jgi:superfamily II DNA helicase RecQ